LAEPPPRVGVGLPTDYELLDLADPRYRWARGFGVQAAGLHRRGAGTPTDPISFIQLSVAVVPDWSASLSTVEPAPSTVDRPAAEPGRPASPAGPPPRTPTRSSPPVGSFGWTGPVEPVGSDAGTGSFGGSGVFGWTEPIEPTEPAGSAESNGMAAPVHAVAGDWLRPPAYLLVNGLPAAELVLERRLPPPGGGTDIRSWTVEVLVPLAGTGHVVVVSGATTDPARQDETEWTVLAVAGTLTYRPGGLPTPAPVAEQPIPELRFANPEQLIAAARQLDPPPPTSPPGSPAGPPRGTIGQAAVDQLAGLVAAHPAASRVEAAGSA
jgi:hypothetical protein